MLLKKHAKISSDIFSKLRLARKKILTDLSPKLRLGPLPILGDSAEMLASADGPKATKRRAYCSP
jgi:hypothetical protein